MATGRWAWLWLAVALSAAAAAADVSYTEEIVNAGVGPKRRGARRTVHEIHLQGPRQRIHTRIEAAPEMQRTLQRRGVPLEATTILRLDQGTVYRIDAGAGTYRVQPLPPPPPPTSADTTAKSPRPAAKPAVATNRDITVRTKVLPDTMRIAGILCHRVAAQMRVRHYKPGSRKVKRTNRYLYQAWMAQGFSGYDEIMAFRQARARRTSLAPPIQGGLEGLEGSSDDAARLQAELQALEGFPMQSELTVYTAVGKRKPRRIFKLTRTILNLSHQTLPDTLFRPAPALKPVK